MLEILHTFTTQAILDVHNHLAESKEKPTLKSWSKSKAELVDRITTLGTQAEIEKSIKATEEPSTKTTAKKAASKKGGSKKGGNKKGGKFGDKPAKKTGDSKPRGPGIGAYAREMIAKHSDETAQQLVDRVVAKFPESNISVKSIGFYRYKMRKAGEL